MGLLGCPGSLLDPAAFQAARNADGGAPAPDAGSGPVCRDVVSEILTNPQVCAAAGCHATSVNQAGLDLEAPDLLGRLWAKPAGPTCSGLYIIDPASPENSLLYSKLLDPAPCGSPMPLGTLLPDEDVECVRQWLLSEMAGRDAGVPTADGGPTDGPVADAGPRDTGFAALDAGTALVQMFEAEDLEIEAPLVVRPGAQAQGGAYVVVPLGPERNEDPLTPGVGRLVLRFTADAADFYRIWMRFRVPHIEANSIWVRMDQGRFIRWNDINLNFEEVWRWEFIKDSDDLEAPIGFNLEPGEHMLEIRRREAGAQLDAIAISRDRTFDPSEPE